MSLEKKIQFYRQITIVDKKQGQTKTNSFTSVTAKRLEKQLLDLLLLFHK